MCIANIVREIIALTIEKGDIFDASFKKKQILHKKAKTFHFERFDRQAKIREKTQLLFVCWIIVHLVFQCLSRGPLFSPREMRKIKRIHWKTSILDSTVYGSPSNSICFATTHSYGEKRTVSFSSFHFRRLVNFNKINVCAMAWKRTERQRRKKTNTRRPRQNFWNERLSFARSSQVHSCLCMPFCLKCVYNMYSARFSFLFNLYRFCSLTVLLALHRIVKILHSCTLIRWIFIFISLWFLMILFTGNLSRFRCGIFWAKWMGRHWASMILQKSESHFFTDICFYTTYRVHRGEGPNKLNAFFSYEKRPINATKSKKIVCFCTKGRIQIRKTPFTRKCAALMPQSFDVMVSFG